ncbi:MAG: DUF2721 domain-containing protein [Chloroflexi bacterium]|nr:DUF2721 domain-containing protein [Chloroflexota bacterium]
MGAITVADLIPVLQVAVGPVILVSGVGLLLLTMTNRLARVIDRSRLLYRELRDTPGADRLNTLAQLRTLDERARLLQRAITLASVSVLLAAVLVIVLFLTAIFRWEDPWLIGLLFIGCMLSLIGSLLAFIRDLNRSLEALRLEVDQVEAAP